MNVVIIKYNVFVMNISLIDNPGVIRTTDNENVLKHIHFLEIPVEFTLSIFHM